MVFEEPINRRLEDPTTDRKTPRLRRRFVRVAKKPSTALSQEAEVGVKLEGPARMARQPLPDGRMLVGGIIVEDGVDSLPAGIRARRHSRSG